LEEQ
jgi:hypothetical protein